MPSERLHVTLTVDNLAGVSVERWPVSSGVPLPPGTIHEGDGMRLCDGQTELPLQWEPLALWPDGSVKWALLDFQTSLAVGESQRLTLCAGSPPPPQERLTVSKTRGMVRITTGPLRVTLCEHEFRLLDAVERRGTAGAFRLVNAQDADTAGLLVRDARGSEYASWRRPVSISIERRGPLRATVAVRGEHVSRTGERCFSFVIRIHAYAGSDLLRLEHLIINDNPTGNFTSFREVALELAPVGGVDCVWVGTDGAKQSADDGAHGIARALGSARVRLFQVDHEHFGLTGVEGQSGGGRAAGWLSAHGPAGCVTIAVKDFWQQWPKSLEVADGRIRIGLCPSLHPGQYDGLEPIEKWYYPFRGRSYRFKTGVAKSHELWLRFAPDLSGGAALGAIVQTPPIAAADPVYAIGTGAWGDLVAAGLPENAEYDALVEKRFQALLDADDVEGHYGLLNWGDWFGERRYNWGNNEYDTGHALFVEFARTGDPRYFHAGRRFARHMADVDIVHAVNDDYLNNGEIDWGYGFPAQVGAMYLHAVGHVAGYFPRKWADKRWPGAYTYGDIHNIGHVWNEGMLDDYYLTGDPWAEQAALEVADNLASFAAIPGNTWWFGKDPHCGRTAGWPLVALCAAYQATGGRKYLRAAQHIIEHALADQDANCGGWIYTLYPGHCHCHLGHVGMATFITAVLLNGMIPYHQLTGDERVAKSIVRAIDFVISDSWVERLGYWRYTSCPATDARPETAILRAIGYALKLEGKPRHREVLHRAWRALMDSMAGDVEVGPGYGKAFAWTHRELSRVVGYLGM